MLKKPPQVLEQLQHNFFLSFLSVIYLKLSYYKIIFK